ncbi:MULTISPECIES: biotin/lipoyl-containing protein [Arthrobacter]|uniref:Pyruvate dehydrogenase E2 component (Dihydrolipoamide acetyltransferase) n=3 Tax=Arthrobacter TaxID=1663 RepID=A0AAW8D9L1_9MICC|nr:MULTISPECIES: biotin/lipoyl-containing protein [Arthrobacter]BAS17432.1 dihydrolipoyllysine-residue acyltransferase component of branched-chain alpha-ketoacid dehydrogenase complex [Arthrobacter sp. Hiyo8]MCZ9880871.1 biotin attachment protein [Arthrobacter sp. B2a2-09]MDP9904957.1 pyruvate dehydrogenase E2 component (dihydrolipoamide acetyltransferase) [Arthrobacter bambusae]MDQ0129773.1 pyruvate dehydrogenase E2 component (dihydrolipoamide acetyltransferase) [Arthrobacter bambusae]MDQ0181
MAEISFPLPDLGEGLIEATVLDWLVSPGDQVERNQPLVELETSKSALELPSPQAGKVIRIHGAPGETINVGEPLVVFEVPDNTAGIVGTVPKDDAPKRRVRLSAVLDED